MRSPAYIQIPAKIRLDAGVVAVDAYSGAVCERWEFPALALMDRDPWGYLKPSESMELFADTFGPDGAPADPRFSLPIACVLATLEQHQQLREALQKQPFRLGLWSDVPRSLNLTQRQDVLHAGCCALLAAYQLSDNIPQDGLALAQRANEVLAEEFRASSFVSEVSDVSRSWLLFTASPEPSSFHSSTPHAAGHAPQLKLQFQYESLDSDSILVSAPESELETILQVVNAEGHQLFAGRVLRTTDELCRVIYPTDELEVTLGSDSH